MNLKQLQAKIEGAETLGTWVESYAPAMPFNPAHWRQASSGGWIYHTAKVANEANIHDDAIVCGTVRNNAQVFDQVQIGFNATIGNDVVVRDHAKVIGKSEAFGRAQMTDYAVLSDSAVIGDYAMLSDHARVFEHGAVRDHCHVSEHGEVRGQTHLRGQVSVNGRACIKGFAYLEGSFVVHGLAVVNGGDWFTPPLYVLDSRGQGATNCAPGRLRISCIELPIKKWVKDFNNIARQYELSKAERKELLAIITLFKQIGK